MAQTRRFLVTRALPSCPAGTVLEAAPEDDPRERVLLWPGDPPTPTVPLHPALGRVSWKGSSQGEPRWVEERPEGCLLADLPEILPQRDAAALVADIADALSLLHGQGLAQGAVDRHRIALRSDGRPVLLGICVEPGTLQSDLKDLRKLHTALVGRPPAIEADDARAYAKALRAWLAPLGGARMLPDLVASAGQVAPLEGQAVELGQDGLRGERVLAHQSMDTFVEDSPFLWRHILGGQHDHLAGTIPRNRGPTRGTHGRAGSGQVSPRAGPG